MEISNKKLYSNPQSRTDDDYHELKDDRVSSLSKILLPPLFSYGFFIGEKDNNNLSLFALFYNKGTGFGGTWGDLLLLAL